MTFEQIRSIVKTISPVHLSTEDFMNLPTPKKYFVAVMLLISALLITGCGLGLHLVYFMHADSLTVISGVAAFVYCNRTYKVARTWATYGFGYWLAIS